jgi:hypothetical protein
MARTMDQIGSKGTTGSGKHHHRQWGSHGCEAKKGDQAGVWPSVTPPFLASSRRVLSMEHRQVIGPPLKTEATIQPAERVCVCVCVCVCRGPWDVRCADVSLT